jgi:hypothetical protein
MKSRNPFLELLGRLAGQASSPDDKIAGKFNKNGFLA